MQILRRIQKITYFLINKHNSSSRIKILGTSLLAVMVFSCTSDDDTPPISANEKNDCVTYAPTELSNTISGTWSEPNEIDDYIDGISIPADVGGGYVKVNLSQSNEKLRPTLIIDNDLESGAAIISGSSVQTNNKLTREAYFPVHPNESYSIRAYPFFNADAEDYPIDYTISWEFISKVDCFEPNDEILEAKKILLGETIEAYAISGYRDYFIDAFSPNTYDWYKIVLDDAAIIEAEVLDMPKDMRITMRLFETSDSIVSYDFEWLSAEVDNNNGRRSKITSSNVLEPGTYYIELHADFVKSRISNSDLEPIPEHFDKSYKIRASKK